MMWYVGQKIVAVKSCSLWKEGDIFTIHAIHQKPCKCKGVCFDLSTLNQHKGGHCCCKCGSNWIDNKTFSIHYEHWFAPLEEADITELMEIINKETQTL